MKIKRGRLQQIIREELTRVLTEADSDGDGKLSSAELRDLADKLDVGGVDVVSRATGEVLRAPASVVADFMGISSDDRRLAGDDPDVQLDADEFEDLRDRMEPKRPKRRSPEELYAELQFNARGAQSEMGSMDLRDGAQAILDGSFSAEEQRSLINHLFEPGADEETLINHTTILMQEPEPEE
jgi:hypothetical protein